MSRRRKWMMWRFAGPLAAATIAMMIGEHGAAQPARPRPEGVLALSCFARQRVGSEDWTTGADLASLAAVVIDRCLTDGAPCDAGMLFDPVALEEDAPMRAFQRRLTRWAARLDRSRAERARAVSQLAQWTSRCGLAAPVELVLDRIESALDRVEAQDGFRQCIARCQPAEAEPAAFAVAVLPSVQCYDGCPGDTEEPLTAMFARRLAAGRTHGAEGLTLEELRAHARRMRRVTTGPLREDRRISERIERAGPR